MGNRTTLHFAFPLACLCLGLKTSDNFCSGRTFLLLWTPGATVGLPFFELLHCCALILAPSGNYSFRGRKRVLYISGSISPNTIAYASQRKRIIKPPTRKNGICSLANGIICFSNKSKSKKSCSRKHFTQNTNDISVESSVRV